MICVALFSVVPVTNEKNILFTANHIIKKFRKKDRLYKGLTTEEESEEKIFFSIISNNCQLCSSQNIMNPLLPKGSPSRLALDRVKSIKSPLAVKGLNWNVFVLTKSVVSKAFLSNGLSFPISVISADKPLVKNAIFSVPLLKNYVMFLSNVLYNKSCHANPDFNFYRLTT